MQGRIWVQFYSSPRIYSCFPAPFVEDTFIASLCFGYLFQLLDCWIYIERCLGPQLYFIDLTSVFVPIPYWFYCYSSIIYLSIWNCNLFSIVPFVENCFVSYVFCVCVLEFFFLFLWRIELAFCLRLYFIIALV